MKKLIFYLFLLISFQGISAVTYENLTEKAENVVDFFLKKHYWNGVNQPVPAIANTINHFNQKDVFGNPRSGIPIYIQKINNNEVVSPFKKYRKICEKALFGHSWEKFKIIWNSGKLKRNNDYFVGVNPIYSDPQQYKIDDKAMLIASKLREHTNIQKDIDIPIIKNDFSCINSFDQNWASQGKMSIISDKLCYHIKTNPWLNEDFPDTVPFQIARELARLERGGKYSPLINLLKTKAILGVTGFLLSYAAFKNGSSDWLKPLTYSIGTLTGIILGNYFKGLISQHEEIARDSRAKKMCKDAGYNCDKGAMKFFSLKAELEPNTVFSDAHWDIKELKIKKHIHLEHPTFLQHLQASQPSPAQRMRNWEEL